MEANLLGVFNERDGERRAAKAIRSTYAPPPMSAGPTMRALSVGHGSAGSEGRQGGCSNIQRRELVFTKASPVYQTLDFGYLAWHLGPEGGCDPVTSGFDVAIVRSTTSSLSFIRSFYQVATGRAAHTPRPPIAVAA